MVDQRGEEIVPAQTHFGQTFESEGVEGEDRRMDGGEMEFHRFEIWVRCDDVEDPVQRQVGGRQGAKGERVKVRLEQGGRPLEWHVL